MESPGTAEAASGRTFPDPSIEESRAGDPAGSIEGARRILSDLGEGFDGHSRAPGDLLDRLEAGRFTLAVLGQFKRGESTSLDALLGEAVLSASVLPSTAVPASISSAAALNFLPPCDAAVIEIGSVFHVPARRRLDGRRAGDASLRTESGMEGVDSHVVDFLARGRTKTLREGLSRKASVTLSDALMRLRLEIRSLLMPLEELQDRLAIFPRRLADAKRERVAAGDLLAGDQRRMHDFLEAQAEALRGKARGYLEGIVQETSAKRPAGLPRSSSTSPLARPRRGGFRDGAGPLLRHPQVERASRVHPAAAHRRRPPRAAAPEGDRRARDPERREPPRGDLPEHRQDPPPLRGAARRARARPGAEVLPAGAVRQDEADGTCGPKAPPSAPRAGARRPPLALLRAAR